LCMKRSVLDHKILSLAFLLLCPLLFPLILHAQGSLSEKTPTYHYQVVRTYPHDRHAFTQGLVYADGALYEGTGLYGRSSLRKVDLVSGRILRQSDLAPAYFGEGVAVFGNRIVQITWQSRTGFVYDKTSFSILKQFSYAHEGWGITHDGKQFIMSDGTSVLHVLDPQDFRERDRIQVHDDKGPVTGLNELEYVKGDIYANIWPTDLVAVINPRTGRIKARINLKGLLSDKESLGVDVLNGIAYDVQGDRLFVTGKLWPKIFEIKVIKSR
jgi:glutaminyl-peptide cyclotransferase